MKATYVKRGDYYHAVIILTSGQKLIAREPMINIKTALKHARAWAQAKRWGY